MGSDREMNDGPRTSGRLSRARRVHCTSAQRTEVLDKDSVLSAHRTSAGVATYLRCRCGALVIELPDGGIVHPAPRPESNAKVAQLIQRGADPSWVGERTDADRGLHQDDRGPDEHARPSDNTEIDHAIRTIEVGLSQTDPDFVGHMRRLERRAVVHAVAVFVLLAVGAVLLLVGMATQTGATWLAGGAALLCSVAVDAYYQRGNERAISRW